jgi:hypothetical protein
MSMVEKPRGGRGKTGRAQPKVTVENMTTSMAMTGPTHEQIAERAYFIWLAKGKPHGRETEHWFEAEEALLRAMEKPPRKKRRAASQG